MLFIHSSRQCLKRLSMQKASTKKIVNVAGSVAIKPAMSRSVHSATCCFCQSGSCFFVLSSNSLVDSVCVVQSYMAVYIHTCTKMKFALGWNMKVTALEINLLTNMKSVKTMIYDCCRRRRSLFLKSLRSQMGIGSVVDLLRSNMKVGDS